jgi:hypothetical protein
MAARVLGILLSRATKFSADGSGFCTSMSCDTTFVCGSGWMVTSITPPPGQMDPAVHCAQGLVARTEP